MHSFLLNSLTTNYFSLSVTVLVVPPEGRQGKAQTKSSNRHNTDMYSENECFPIKVVGGISETILHCFS